MYKRYMIFSWSDFDNVSPFECIDGHTDSLSDAKVMYSSILTNDGRACIFDRVDGLVITVENMK